MIKTPYLEYLYQIGGSPTHEIFVAEFFLHIPSLYGYDLGTREYIFFNVGPGILYFKRRLR
jgi:hypothetical protein